MENNTTIEFMTVHRVTMSNVQYYQLDSILLLWLVDNNKMYYFYYYWYYVSRQLDSNIIVMVSRQ